MSYSDIATSGIAQSKRYVAKASSLLKDRERKDKKLDDLKMMLTFSQFEGKQKKEFKEGPYKDLITSPGFRKYFGGKDFPTWDEAYAGKPFVIGGISLPFSSLSSVIGMGNLDSKDLRALVAMMGK
jgi:hypothetical protein